MKAISLVFLNGTFVAEQSMLSALPSDVAFDFTKGVSLHFPKTVMMDIPIHLLFLTNKNVVFQKKIIVAENVQVSIIEEHVMLQAVACAVEMTAEIVLEKLAHCYYYKKHNKTQGGHYLNSLQVIQKNQSHFAMWTSDMGTTDLKQQVDVVLQESHATCQLHGLYALNDDQESHQQDIKIEHVAPHGTSAMFFKGILDQQSRANFKGKVHVHKTATQTKALQANHTLLLSHKAEVRTQPELEIHAEDIQCAHGATVSEVDDAALFYLRSRGMNKDNALRMLISAFTAEVMHKIPHHDIKRYFMKELGLYEEY